MNSPQASRSLCPDQNGGRTFFFFEMYLYSTHTHTHKTNKWRKNLVSKHSGQQRRKRQHRSVTAEISPARVVYPYNRYKQIFSCYLFLILCFLGWSVETVRGPVRKAVHGPGPWGGGGGGRGGSVFSSHPILCPVVSLIITEVLDKQLRVKISDNNFE